jgi:hypothetical protein
MLLSGIVLIALVAGPNLVTESEDSVGEGLGPESGEAPVVQAAATIWDGEAVDQAKEDKNRADSTGAQHERYFPGRQAM